MRNALALILIISVGAAFRVSGMSYDLPNAYNPDDVYTMDKVVARLDGTYDQGSDIHGSLHDSIIATGIRLVSFVSPAVKQGYPTFQEIYTRDRSIFFVIARLVNALSSTATILVLFVLTRMLLGDTVALFSSLMVSLNVLEIQYAHELYAETILMLMGAVTLFLLVHAWKTHRFSSLVFAALLISLASMQKVFAVFLLLIYAPVYLWVASRLVGNPHVRGASYLLLMIYVGIMVYVLYPVFSEELAWLGSNTWLQDTSSYGDPLGIIKTDYRSHFIELIKRLRDSMGLFPFLFGIVGMFMSLPKRHMFLLPVSACIIVYLLIMAIMLPYWDTNLLMILPMMSLLAGLGIVGASRLLGALLRGKVIGYVCMSVLLIPAFVKSYWFSASYTIPDTRTGEVQWMKDHAVDPSVVARDGFTAVTLPPPDTLTSKLSREQLAKFDYVVLSSWYSRHFSNPARKTPELAAMFEDIRTTYEKVAEFAPTKADPFVDDLTILTNPRSWRNLRYIRGPTITIYRRPTTL